MCFEAAALCHGGRSRKTHREKHFGFKTWPEMARFTRSSADVEVEFSLAKHL